MKNGFIGHKIFLEKMMKKGGYNKKQVKKMEKIFIDSLKDTLEMEDVDRIIFRHFGSFYIHKTKSRWRILPSGQGVISKSREIVKFQLSRGIKLKKNKKKGE